MENNNTQRSVLPQDLSELGRGTDFVSAHVKKILTAVLVVHVIATLFFFPPQEIFNKKPVITLDHAFHYYQVRRAGEVFWSTGRLHSYDPYFMAGYPSAIFDLDVKAAELFCSPFGGDAVAVAFKIFILLCYLTIVGTVYKGCRYLGWTNREAVFAVLVFLVFWHWGRPYASHFRYAGMFEFILVSHLAILVVGLFNRFLSGKNTIWFFVLGTLAFFVHPTAVIILDIPFVVLIILRRHRLTPGRTLLFILWCLCVVIANAVWVIPFFEYAGIKTASNVFFQTSGLHGLRCALFHPGCLPAIALVILVLPGVWRLRSEGRGTGAWAVLSAVGFLLFVTAYGIRIPGLRHLEPGRFMLPALFFAAPLAGCGFVWLLDGVMRWVPVPETRRRVEATVVSAFLIAAVCLSFLSSRTAYRHRLFTTPSPDVQELLDAVVTHVDPSGRVMIEDGPAALYDEVHLPGIMPALTGVEQIGGPYPFAFITHHFATFQTDCMMGRPLASISAIEFRGYLDLYNIGWIVTASPAGREAVSLLLENKGATRLAERPQPDGGGEIVWTSDRFTLWRLNRRRSFTGNPDDRVRSSYNRIEIELATSPDRFLLRYHWDDRLTANPPVTLSKVFHLDDPVPFVLVEPHGVSSIIIKY